MYFIQLISVAVFVLSTGLFAQQPQSPNGHCAGGLRLRKEIRALTEQERIAFIRAAQRLQVAGGNGYDWLTARHIESGKDVHGTLMFLAFHRSFTNIYQNLINRIDPNVTLPYWESTADAFAMHKSPIFSSFWMGGNGWGPENCLLSGPFSGATRAIVSSGDGTEVVVNSGIGGEADPGESRKCMRRKFNAGNTIRGTYDRMYMRNLVNYAKNQRTFWGGMEDGPHTTIHFGVGGDMKTMVSSNDPLFYVHHSYVDKVWDDWLRAHPERSLDFGGTRGFNSMFA
ncbi:Di-copper centre-containing protein, partial [Ramicandelaber brevisporus]